MQTFVNYQMRGENLLHCQMKYQMPLRFVMQSTSNGIKDTLLFKQIDLGMQYRKGWKYWAGDSSKIYLPTNSNNLQEQSLEGRYWAGETKTDTSNPWMYITCIQDCIRWQNLVLIFFLQKTISLKGFSQFWI